MIYLVMIGCLLVGASGAMMIWGRPPRQSILIHPSPEREAEIAAKRRNRSLIVGTSVGLLAAIGAAWADGHYGGGNMFFQRRPDVQTDKTDPHADEVWVDGYTKEDGTKVKGHYRSKADSDPSNNWSERGNVNPHTGKPGDKTD